MLRRLLFAISILLVCLPAFAGKCTCQDQHKNGKQSCFDNVASCKNYCGTMSMSFATGSCTSNLEPPKSLTYYVHASQQWTDSRIDVQSDDVYVVTVFAEDSWQTNKSWINGGTGGHPYYKAGPSYLVPGGPEGALVGRIGENPAFIIGKHGKTPKGQSGRLYFAANDEPKGLHDNRGNAQIEVHKEGLPLSGYKRKVDPTKGVYKDRD